MNVNGTMVPYYDLKLPLGEAVENFNLAKAVCSHGLFMMAPNHWDPLSDTLSRPLRLNNSPCPSSSSSLTVQISHPKTHPHSLNLRVFGTKSLSNEHQQALLDQVKRMLRLSENEERNVREFRKVLDKIECFECFGGRVFRSPTLFEDMVKCILLCNCQWPRTLSMARALCELQLDLQSRSSNVSLSQAGTLRAKSLRVEDTGFNPKTPRKHESKEKLEVSTVSPELVSHFAETALRLEVDTCWTADSQNTRVKARHVENMSSKTCLSVSSEAHKAELNLDSDSQFSEGIKTIFFHKTGNFPSPSELAGLDEKFLANRCNLGYRAKRILKLARGIVEGNVHLEEFDEFERQGVATISSYNKLAEQLRDIEGFGPFTRANVLMCMGFYHVIPTDSETIRHLKQVHARNSSLQSVQKDIEDIYGKYAPFQFLAYWAEVWQFYEQRFGKLSEMPCTDYKLITASNMKSRANGKRRKIS